MQDEPGESWAGCGGPGGGRDVGVVRARSARLPVHNPTTCP